MATSSSAGAEQPQKLAGKIGRWGLPQNIKEKLTTRRVPHMQMGCHDPLDGERAEISELGLLLSKLAATADRVSSAAEALATAPVDLMQQVSAAYPVDHSCRPILRHLETNFKHILRHAEAELVLGDFRAKVIGMQQKQHAASEAFAHLDRAWHKRKEFQNFKDALEEARACASAALEDKLQNLGHATALMCRYYMAVFGGIASALSGCGELATELGRATESVIAITDHRLPVPTTSHESIPPYFEGDICAAPTVVEEWPMAASRDYPSHTLNHSVSENWSRGSRSQHIAMPSDWRTHAAGILASPCDQRSFLAPRHYSNQARCAHANGFQARDYSINAPTLDDWADVKYVRESHAGLYHDRNGAPNPSKLVLGAMEDSSSTPGTIHRSSHRRDGYYQLPTRSEAHQVSATLSPRDRAAMHLRSWDALARC